MFNHAETPFKVNKGDRIAQLICERIFYPELEECKVSVLTHFFLSVCLHVLLFLIIVCNHFIFQELSDTERGEGGFGSTGTK